MKMNIAFSYLALVLFVAAEDIDEHDVPPACLPDCRSLIDLSAGCENSTDRDSAFNACVCGDTSAESMFNSCATCAKQNGFTADDDNDVASLMTDCGLEFDAAGTSGGNNTGGLATSTVTSTSGSTTVVVTTTSTPSAASQTSGGGATSADGSAAAGAHATAGIGVVVAGLAIGITLPV